VQNSRLISRPFKPDIRVNWHWLATFENKRCHADGLDGSGATHASA